MDEHEHLQIKRRMKNYLSKIKSEITLIYSTKSQSDNGKRITFIDMARGLAILLVVMGHRGFITERTNIFISSFHLPLFFIASGMLFELKSERLVETSTFFKRKIKSLFIPYFFFSVCSMLLDLYFKPTGAENAISDLKLHLVETFTLQGYSVLWFLPVVFIAESILYFLYRKFDIKILIPLLVASSIGMYYVYAVSVLMMPAIVINLFRILVKAVIAATFMCAGMVLTKIMGLKNDSHDCSFNVAGLVVGIVMITVNILASGYISLKDLNNLNVGYISLYFLLGICGSVGVFFICKSIVNIAPLTYFGRNSLVVFCTHANCYVLYFGTVLYLAFSNRGLLPYIINDQITANTYSMIFTFLLEIPIIMFLNIFLPVVVGKKR